MLKSLEISKNKNVYYYYKLFVRFQEALDELMQMQMLSPALAIQVLHQVLFKFLVKPFESIHMSVLKFLNFLAFLVRISDQQKLHNVFKNVLVVHTSILLC